MSFSTLWRVIPIKRNKDVQVVLLLIQIVIPKDQMWWQIVKRQEVMFCLVATITTNRSKKNKA